MRVVAAFIVLVVLIGAYALHARTRDVVDGVVPLAGRPAQLLAPYFQLVSSETRAADGRDAAIVGPLRSTDRVHTLRTATIRNDTRYVLPGVEHAALVFRENVKVGPQRSIDFKVPLPPALRHATRLLINPRIKVQGKKRAMSPTEVALAEENGERVATFTLATPDLDPGMSIGVFVEGFALGAGDLRHRTAPMRIPSGAALEFAMGIAEPAWELGPARFEVEACEADACEVAFRETVDPATDANRDWQLRRVALERYADKDISFRLSAEAASWSSTALSLPMWANPTVYAPPPRADAAPNVILLSIDTLGAKHVSTYGSANDTMPFVRDTFERNGVVFDHCVAAATTTPPSHMSMFTSVHPCVHKLQTGFEVVPDWIVTLSETLRDAGIETGAVTEDGWLGIRHGFGRGFNTYVENTSPDLMEPLGQIDLTFDKARDWLRAHRDKRFFLFLHTFQVHDPYSPPPAYADLFVPDADLAGDAKRPQRESVLYDREIRYTDDHLKALFQTLAELDLDERTIFLVTSDHGEEFFEHGLWGHGGTLYQEVSHVPFMAWGPGVAKGKRVAGPVGHIDLMPTILGLANVPPPPQVLGIDLSATLRDPDAHPVTNRPLFSEAWAEVGHGVGYELVKFERPGYMVQVGTEKLMRIRRQGQPVYERYDLASDPAERRNLYVEGAPDPLGLRAAVDGYEATCAQLAEHLRQQAGGSKDSPAKVQLSPEQEEKLRALGYLH